MRLTPSQIGMLNLLGEHLPFGMPENMSLSEIIESGRSFLVKIAEVDFGYDLNAWHEHLKTTDAGGYCWDDNYLEMPIQIAKAIANPKWQQAVAELRSAKQS